MPTHKVHDFLRRQNEAIAHTLICQLPMCEAEPLRDESGKSVGICLTHSFDILNVLDALGDRIDLDKTRLGLRERRVKRELHERVLGEKERERRRQQPGWIYYILLNDRIKIGYSKDVKQRLTAYPFDTPLLAMHPGTKQLETQMHTKFAGSRAAGREYFLDTPELRQHIREVIEQFGEPDRARYERRGQRANPRLKAS